ncbi:stress-induced-phosphoprotein 1-like [Paramacrobiotus metropolitanus]|uniref:stress-induced-phosphoprotein 1-like n=1 Tax=Paramacrobiotus metropolitanus TaxID=2943436 RepID=UPI0024464A30|nr:stress-induced-phosphoprotein 1-like [Paramacrobiotus metropolitanus]
MDSGSTEPYGNRNAAAAAHLQYGITLVHPCLKQFAVKTIESQSSTLTAATVAYFKTNFHDFSQTIYFILDNWKNGGFDQGCKKMLKTYLRRCRNIRNDVSHQTYRNTDSHDRRIEDLCHVMREIGHPLEAENLQNFMKPQPLVNTSWEKLKQLGNQHYKEGRYTEAMISYTEALKEKPDEPALYSNRALCEMQLERFEDARNDGEDALNLDANNVKFYRILS